MKKLLYLMLFAGIGVLWPVISAAQETFSLTLDEAVGTALRQNLGLRTEELDVEAARGDVLISEGEFEPAVQLGVAHADSTRATASQLVPSELEETSAFAAFRGKLRTGTQYELRWDNRRAKSNLAFLEVNPYYASELVLSFTQPLLKGFGSTVQTAALRVAENRVLIETLDQNARAEEILLQTAGTYWDLYFRLKQVQVAEQALALSEAVLNEVREKIRVGALARIEEAEAEAQVYARREELIAARKALRDTEDSLRTILNLEDWTREIIPVDDPLPPEGPVMEEPLEDVLARSFEYRAALKTLQSTGITRNFYRNQLLPDLSLVGAGGLTGVRGEYMDALEDVGKAEFLSWEVGLNLTVPVGNSAAKGYYRKAVAEEDRARLSLRQIEQNVRADVREALRSMEASKEAYEAALKRAEAARQRYEAERERFRVGLAFLNDVLRLEVDYSTALANQFRALADYAFSVISYQEATGRALERFRRQ